MEGQKAAHSNLESMAMTSFAFAATHPTFYHSATGLTTKMQALIPNKLGAWTQCRTAPKPASKTLHQLLKEKQTLADDHSGNKSSEDKS